MIGTDESSSRFSPESRILNFVGSGFEIIYHRKFAKTVVPGTQPDPMRCLVTSKWGGTLLVLLGFACWIGTGRTAMHSDWEDLASFAVGGFAFFLVACFLPDYRNKYLWAGRRSALQLMAFFFWLAGNAGIRLGVVKEWEWVTDSRSELVLGSLLVAFGSYYAAKFLIRGFRAPAVYAEEPEITAEKEWQQRTEIHK